MCDSNTTNSGSTWNPDDTFCTGSVAAVATAECTELCVECGVGAKEEEEEEEAEAETKAASRGGGEAGLGLGT